MINNMPIKKGQIYSGEYLSLYNGDYHKSIIFFVSPTNSEVYSFCITSEEDTIKKLRFLDSNAVVDVPEELVQKLFKKDPKQSWVYCGLTNRKTSNLELLKIAINQHEVELITDVDENSDFFTDIVFAVRNSNTYSEDDLSEMGL